MNDKMKIMILLTPLLGAAGYTESNLLGFSYFTCLIGALLGWIVGDIKS